MTLLSAEDSARVESAIQEAERGTATELVVAVVPRSGDYWHGRVLVAFAWALGAGFTVAHYFPSENSAWALLAQIPAALLAYALFGIPAWWRLLIPPAQASAMVAERAFALFSERGIHRTRDRTGMLILVSELEHRVVILGDTGIHEHVGDSGWQEYVSVIIAAIKKGRLADGLIDVIGQVAKLHGEHLPVSKDDQNELSNAVLRAPR